MDHWRGRTVFYPSEREYEGISLAFEGLYYVEIFLYVIRWRIDQCFEFEIIRVTRGESSHYTLPRVVSMCGPEGHTCLLEIMCFVIMYAMYYSDQTGGSNDLRGQRVLNQTGPEGLTS